MSECAWAPNVAPSSGAPRSTWDGALRAASSPRSAFAVFIAAQPRASARQATHEVAEGNGDAKRRERILFHVTAARLQPLILAGEEFVSLAAQALRRRVGGRRDAV